MSRLQQMVRSVAKVSPQFNDYALRGFIKKEINNSHEFPALVFREGFKLTTSADIELVDYEILPPEDQVRFELSSETNRNNRIARIPLTMTHMRLVRYRIRFADRYIYSHLYMPYMYEDMLYMRDKRSMIRKVILEKTFSRVSDHNKDGITVSPIRVNIPFYRRHTFKAISYVSDEVYNHFIITAGLFHGPRKKKKICDTTILHYMLARFGFSETLKRFGLNDHDVKFVEKISNDTDHYDYFAANKTDKKGYEDPGLFLKVSRVLLGEDLARKFIVNLLFVIHHSLYIQTLDNVYTNKGSIWRVILGSITFDEEDPFKAQSNAETNLRSADSFIDPITKERFDYYGIPINDTYDLLVYIFLNIDEYVVQNVSQNLYNTRIDVRNGLLVNTIARAIFTNKLYVLARKSNIKEIDAKRAIKLSPMLFKQSISGRVDDDKDYVAPPSIVGDNFLLAGGLNKIRMGGKPEHRLHPSMLVVESVGVYAGKTIGKTGYINPFVPTDPYGTIVRPDYASDIEAIMPFLPK